MVLPNVDYIVFERGLVDISFMLIIVSALSGTDITHEESKSGS